MRHHQPTEKHLLSVVTLSSRGPQYVKRAIQSIAAQDFKGPKEIIIIGDNPRWRPEILAYLTTKQLTIRCFNIQTDKHFASLPTVKRVSRLRNIALTLVEGDYFCFLDDDNQWEKNHLSTLFTALQQHGRQAAHCWRNLLDRKGNPWIATCFPWRCEPDRAKQLFRKFTAAGMLSTSEPIFRDSACAVVDGEDVSAVDMGAWLFSGGIIDLVRFETEYSHWEIRNSVTEDDKLLARLKDGGIPIACSKTATLNYYLGGYSNLQTGTPRHNPKKV